MASWVSKVSLGFIDFFFDETVGGLGGFLLDSPSVGGHFGRILRDHWGLLGVLKLGFV